MIDFLIYLRLSRPTRKCLPILLIKWMVWVTNKTQQLKRINLEKNKVNIDFIENYPSYFINLRNKILNNNLIIILGNWRFKGEFCCPYECFNFHLQINEVERSSKLKYGRMGLTKQGFKQNQILRIQKAWSVVYKDLK